MVDPAFKPRKSRLGAHALKYISLFLGLYRHRKFKEATFQQANTDCIRKEEVDSTLSLYTTLQPLNCGV